jgi:hypothetical protein
MSIITGDTGNLAQSRDHKQETLGGKGGRKKYEQKTFWKPRKMEGGMRWL